ncbi:MAG: hypothetical protein LBB91_07200 [Clostridiales bacterium]|jgi:uncharacterized repeat protein (TIGR01451 family)|nr:hypothetical protein [Clostridiales bacterium]
MKKAISIILIFLLLISLSHAVFASQKASNPGNRSGVDGLDLNPLVGQHNSYAWSSEMFEQTDGDYLWVGMNRDMGGHTLNRIGVDPGTYPRLGVPSVSPDGVGRIYRQRASDPDAPWELVYADPHINGYRKMITYNGDLYVLAGLTNIPLANYSYVLRFSKDFKPGDRPQIVLWEKIPGTDMDLHLTGSALEYFRAAAVLDGKLYIGTYDSKILVTDGSGLKDLTPNSGDGKTGWSLAVDFTQHGVGVPIVWDLLPFNGSIYAFCNTFRGFRIDQVTPVPGGYQVDQIVGDPPAQIAHGMGNNGNMAASGYISTSFGKEYMYVATYADAPGMFTNYANGDIDRVFNVNFNPASIFRLDTEGNWEVVVGDKSGHLAAVYRDGTPIPNIGNQRAGFSLVPEGRINTSLNQYIWQLIEHEGKMYATTLDLGSLWIYGLWCVAYLSSVVPGAEFVVREHVDEWIYVHELLARDAYLVDFDAVAVAIDEYLLEAGEQPIETVEDLRLAVEGLVEVMALFAPSEDLKRDVFLVVDIIMEILLTVELPNLTAREIAEDFVASYKLTAAYFGDDSNPIGFDLYVSDDGVNFEPVTVDGLGDECNYGGRIMVSSEHGLHLGTANPYNGGQVWRVDPIKLDVKPNGPQEFNLSQYGTAAMTVLVTDARATGSSLNVSYDSELVDVRLSKRSTKKLTDIFWDNRLVYDSDRDLWLYDVAEIETKYESDIYDVFFTPIKAGREELTLDFAAGGISASRTVDLTVDLPGSSDNESLGEKIIEASTLNRSDYTAASWTQLLTAYLTATEVYNTSATQTQINAAFSNLSQAIDGLVPAGAPPGFTVIRTEADLREINKTTSSRKGNYWLANDIVLSSPWKPISSFAGIFDGNGRTISNLMINNPSLSEQGFFRITRSGAVIKDLEIQVADSGVNGRYRVGALVGRAYSTTIMAVRVMLGDNGVTGRQYVGGIVGRASDSVIGGCFVYGPSGLNELYINHPEPDNTFAVRGKSVTSTNTGGLAGYLYKTVVSSSASYINVTGYMGVGGLIGNARMSVVENSFARGYVLGQTQLAGSRFIYGQGIGGLIGLMGSTMSVIENVYATGVVKSSGSRRVNPLVGYASSSVFGRGMSFYDTDISQKSSVGVQDMKNITMGRISGASLRNMRIRDTFVKSGSSWDFDTIWSIGLFEGTPFYAPTYPYFIAGIALASNPPIVRTVVTGAPMIEGVGHEADSLISVELPDGTILETKTDQNLEWSVEIPRGVKFAKNDKIKVTQQEAGMPQSSEHISYVQLDLPIDISVEMEMENITSGDTGMNFAGDQIRCSITVSNDGNPAERADRIQVSDVLPPGLTLVTGSVRYLAESDEGDEVITKIPKNTGGIGASGYSFNAATRMLEIRLGDYKLYGGNNVIVEFDLTIDPSAKGTDIAPNPAGVTANRVSKSSNDNILTDSAVFEGLYVER